MKSLLCAFLFVLLFSAGHGQTSLPAYPDSMFSTYYWQRVTHFNTLPQHPHDVIFLGNSITDGAEWTELFGNARIKNRGISGDVVPGVINRLSALMTGRPAKIFLLIGVNDLARNIPPDTIVKQIFLIASYIRKQSPDTKLFVQSILPVNDSFGRFAGHVSKGRQIQQVNRLLSENEQRYGYHFIDMYQSFVNRDGKLNAGYTNDGLHLAGDGYLLWKTLIYPYVFDATDKPALIPMPQQAIWGRGFFPLYQCKAIVCADPNLMPEAERLRAILLKNGWDIPVRNTFEAQSIQIKSGPVAAPANKEEAYMLRVNAAGVVLTINDAHGAFNGIQTLRQLMRDGISLPACTITDWPAFAWRGYMIDAGRNFMPVNLLKQQIEVMSQYKLNVFHFHFTEDIAWRLAFRNYPQLTDASTMLRNKGQFYSEQEMQDLISYCNDRHITLVPEIDMPGHSAAFRRAMHTDMQSDTGLAIVKDILKEFFATYDLPYIHIGADEVKITNKAFLPEVIDLIRKYKKKIIGWEPGGNFTDDVIRQLWTGDAGEAVAKNPRLRIIDSRHLYLNHMDPLEAVTTIFFRQIDDKPQGDANLLGATVCMWPDRRVEEPLDVFRMNPLYPGMVTFAERVWKGGGKRGWTAVIGAPASATAKEFTAFEDRLIDHRRQYFSELPFPYARQAGMQWTLYGPYDNGGDLQKKLLPELNNFDTATMTPFARETGGTIVLRHWWYPMIAGAVPHPKENTTVYAMTRIWSNQAAVKKFWIGFNNISRSPETDSPPPGEWDEKKSRIWVNGDIVAPPAWKRAGMKGDAEIPLTDEGYEYRAPEEIPLRKGWNIVWIKAPVGSFTGRNWHNPVKWEFTFVEAFGQ